MSTPSITPLQLVAATLGILAFLAAGLLPIDDTVRDELIGLAKFLVGALVLGDAALRTARTFNVEHVLRAKAIHAAAQVAAADTDDDPSRIGKGEAAAALGVLIAVACAIAVPLLMVGAPTTYGATPTQNLEDGRAHVIVGRPIAKPGAPLRRIYPTGTSPRGGITLIAARSSLPHYWETHELTTVREWAQRRGWRTSEKVRGGIDVTPHLTGKEYRVDRRILTALNATARRAGSTCNVLSGWRDSNLQTKLYQLFLAGMGNPANPPGTSKHEAPGRGMPARAADTYCNGVTFWVWARARGVDAFARSRGLRMPYAHEPWHVEYAASGT